LPPIIFAAGYNLRRRSFFKYFLYIFLYGVVGTIITFSIVTPLTYIANSYQLFTVTFGKEYEQASHNHTILTNITGGNYSTETDGMDTTSESLILNFSFREILLFSSVIAATDTVAALTFIKEEKEPKLFAILFGEGVINDAVCIVLYGIIRDFTASGEEFTSKTPFKMFSSFLSMFFFSFIIGAGVGCLSAVFLKKLKDYNLNRVQECSIIVFFAFISYTLTEELGLSPIIALLFTGIFMSHYTFYNLSFQAREESSVVSRIMSNIAEAFVFTYLGLTVIYNTILAFSFSFFFWELIFVVLGRVCAIYGISYAMSLLKVRAFTIKNSQKGIMSCAGSIRGAIAFGLAISIDSNNRINK
jgi:NhaP-type Na+/H+ or K+/H+ antiporter